MTTEKQKAEALTFFEKKYNQETRDLENHSPYDTTYEARQKYILSFFRHIKTIRAALQPTPPTINEESTK